MHNDTCRFMFHSLGLDFKKLLAFLLSSSYFKKYKKKCTVSQDPVFQEVERTQ
jgi:hypothetical protein